MRRDCSLLLSEGHAFARHYPLAYLWSEARMVRQRNNARLQQETILLQTAIVSIFGKEGVTQLNNLLKRIGDGD